jgi:hypothetical protein
MRKRAAAWACRPGELSGQLGDSSSGPGGRASSATIPSVPLRSGTLLASSPMSRGRRSRSLTGRRICGACGPSGTASSTRSMKNGGQSRSTTSPDCRSPGISKPCRRYRSVADSRLSPWNAWTGSWTESSVQSGPLVARLRGICAASAHGAPGRTSHNPPVVGSSPPAPPATHARPQTPPVRCARRRRRPRIVLHRCV